MVDGPGPLSLPLEAERLIPHRPPLRFIDRLVEFKDNAGLVEATIPADNPLVDENGLVDPLISAELMAQAYAAVKGYADLMAGREIKKGFLVGVKKLQVSGAPLAGERLLVAVRTVAVLGAFAVAEATVDATGRRIASATLKLWILEDEP